METIKIITKDAFQKTANKVSFITIIGNMLLSIFKLLAGLIAHSNAMISDAVHSASDVFSTIVVIIVWLFLYLLLKLPLTFLRMPWIR